MHQKNTSGSPLIYPTATPPIEVAWGEVVDHPELLLGCEPTDEPVTASTAEPVLDLDGQHEAADVNKPGTDEPDTDEDSAGDEADTSPPESVKAVPGSKSRRPQRRDPQGENR